MNTEETVEQFEPGCSICGEPAFPGWNLCPKHQKSARNEIDSLREWFHVLDDRNKRHRDELKKRKGKK